LSSVKDQADPKSNKTKTSNCGRAQYSYNNLDKSSYREIIMTNFVRGPCDDVAIPSECTLKIKRNCEKWILVATILGSSMAFIDSTIVNVALPALQESFHTSISQMQWVIEAYALTLGTLLLVGGALGDIYGHRKIFLIGIVIFAGASAWCGLASTITYLIAARTIQGIGAALLVPGSLAIISTSFPEERRGQAIGTWAGFTAITTAAGPVVGGWLLQHASWRWIFFINLPLAIIVVLVSLFYVSESKNEQQPPQLDLIGALLATTGFAAIVFSLIEWEYNSMVIISLITGVCALIGFFFVETQVSYPIVPLAMFRSRNFSGANLITFFLYFALSGVLFFLPLDLIQVQGYSPTEAGAAMLPLILLIFLLSRWAGGLIKRFSPKIPLVVGPAIAALGFALFLRAGIGRSYWVGFFPATVILGLGMAICIAPLTTVVMISIPPSHAGAASGVNNAISRIAGLLAVAILGFIMTMIFNQQLAKRLKSSTIPVTMQDNIIKQQSLLANIKTNDERAQQIIQQSFLSGYKVVLIIATVLALASSLSAAMIIVVYN
jgi:EmrB/QacA subfamily drug resistance transporter